MNTKKEATNAKALPQVIQDLLGKPPLVTGEDAGRYDALFNMITEYFKPRDFIEILYVREYTDAVWELQRLNGYRAKIISNDCPHTLAALLQTHPDFGEGTNEPMQRARQLAYAFCAGEPEALLSVPRLLATLGLNMEAVPAMAFTRQLAGVEAIARLQAVAFALRDNTLVEFEHHRKAFGDAPRDVGGGPFIEAPKLAEPGAGGPDSQQGEQATKTSGNPA